METTYLLPFGCCPVRNNCLVFGMFFVLFRPYYIFIHLFIRIKRLIANFLAHKFASTIFSHITPYVVKFTGSTVFSSVKAKN